MVGCDRWVSSSQPLSQGRFLSSPSLFRLVGHKPKRNWWISIHLGFLKGLFQNDTLVRLSADELRSRSLPKICRMDIIDLICDERLALTDILTEPRRHLVNVLRNVEVINLEDLDNILQQYCRLRRNVIAAMKSLDVLEEDYRRYRC